MSVPTKTLYNGVKIPVVGFGTWQLPDGPVAYDAVTLALKSGYTSIDTATDYGNERSVGRAIKDSGLKREDLFITTKHNQHHSYELALQRFEESLDMLGLEYLDLYLIHWPGQKNERTVQAWKAFEKLYKDGRIRAIGVSNFLPHHLDMLRAETEILPMVNQLEAHPYLLRKEALAYCEKNKILVEAWSPLQNGKDVLKDPVIEEIADRYGKTVAQTILRWHLDCGRRIIPRSANEGRIKENIDLFGFSLDPADIEAISALSVKNIGSGLEPDVLDWNEKGEWKLF